MVNEEHVRGLKKHRNALYTLVFVMLVLQVVSFVILSTQVSQSQAELAQTRLALANTSRVLSETQARYQQQTDQAVSDLSLNFNALSQSVSQQKTSLDQEIKLLKSSQGDFSNIVEEAVKGVVTVRTDKSIGTGFIINREGYIVTNAHVIAGAQRLAVVTYDRQLISAQLIGSDAVRDVALLKIEGTHPALTLADTADVRVGNKGIAI